MKKPVCLFISVAAALSMIFAAYSENEEYSEAPADAPAYAPVLSYVVRDDGEVFVYSSDGITRSYYEGIAEKDGVKCYAESGKLISGWRKVNGNWHYFDNATKEMAFGTAKIAGNNYYFDKNGAWTGRLSKTAVHPDDFSFAFTGGYVAERVDGIDTGKGLIYKDLVADGQAKAEYKIPRKDLQVIYAMFRECEIADLAVWGFNSAAEATVLPNMLYEIRFVSKGAEYLLKADSAVLNLKSDEAKNFLKFSTFIINYFSETEAFKSLPKVNGGYD